MASCHTISFGKINICSYVKCKKSFNTQISSNKDNETMNRFENVRVAIAMATCNTDSKMLKQSIDSILNQSHTNFKFYIVNDSGENISQLKEITDGRVVIIEHEKKLGLAKSMNEIIDIMNEKYFFRMDADDISIPDRLSKQIDFMEKNIDIDVASLYGVKIGSEKGPLYPMWDDPEHIKALLLFTNTFIHSSVVFRSSFLKKNGIRYDEAYAASQDYDMWNRCCRATKICVIPQIGILYRIHNNQVSSEKKYIQQHFLQLVMKKNLQELGLETENVDCLNMLAGKKRVIDLMSYTNLISKIIENNESLCKYEKKILKEVVAFYFFRSIICSRLFIKALLNKKSRKIIVRYSILKNVLKMYLKRFQLNCISIFHKEFYSL